MIGPRSAIPAARWAEKLAAPCALVALEGLLYRPPARPGGAATVAWISDADPDAALALALRRAEVDGAATLYVGGPPGNYLVSGVEAAQVAWFRARGFEARDAHVELTVAARGARPDARVTVADDVDAALAWVATSFGAHWRDEAQRAAAHGGLRVTRDEAGLTGFVADGGNNVDAGTFGPLGVLARARGGGLGEALTRTALHALAAQGFEEVTVPWVDPAVVPFYARAAPVLRVLERTRMARRIARER